MNNLIEINNNEIVIDSQFVEKYKEFKRNQAIMEIAEKELKAQLEEAMSTLDKPTVIQSGLSITYKKPTTRTAIDSKRLKEQLPDIFEEFSKTSDVKGSVTIKVEL